MENSDLENFAMPLIRYDRFGRSIWHNTLAQTMLITPMEQILSIPPSNPEPFSIHVARYFRTLHDVLKTGSPSEFELTFNSLPKKEPKSFLIRFLPELDEAGSLVGIMAAAEEITDKSLEKQSSVRG